MDFSWVLPVLTGVVIGVIGWLLSNKDKQQAKEIADNKAHHDAVILELKAHFESQVKILFDLHSVDANKLAELQLEVAREHYRKQELDAKFDRLEHTFAAGLEKISAQLQELNKHFVDHMVDERKKDNQ